MAPRLWSESANWLWSLQYAWALHILYPSAICLAKVSLLFQLIHIFAPTKSGPVYWAFHSLIWGNLAFYVSIFISMIFQCYRVWEGRSPTNKGHCAGSKTLLVVCGAVNVFSDLLIILLPVWNTWHLQMTPKRKAGVIAMFSTGFL